MEAIPFLNRLSTKFSALVFALLVISWGITLVLGDRNLNKVANIGERGAVILQKEVATLQVGAAESLVASQKLEIAVVESQNQYEKSKHQTEIVSKRSFLNGKIAGALLIIGSQLESILSPMAQDEREMFAVNAEVYEEVLEGVQEINFWPVFDAETLAEIAADEEFDEARTATLSKVIETKATGFAPVVDIDPKAKVIRVAAFLGPESERFGVLEVYLEDIITPLDNALLALDQKFSAAIKQRSEELAKQTDQRRRELAEAGRVSAEGAAQRHQESEDVGVQSRISLAVAAILGTLISSVIIGALMINLISRPMRRYIDNMSEIASDDLSSEINGTERRDEIGLLARNVLAFKTSVEKRFKAEAAQAADEKVREQKKNKEEMKVAQKLETGLSQAVDEISDQLSGVNGIAGKLNVAADDTRKRTSEVMSATTEASRNVQSVTQSAVELSNSMNEIQSHVQEATVVSDTASQLASDAEQTVRQLGEAAVSIGEVVEIIQGIAEQTNLLALNATIESARAGEAGKGFAVVAGEVKNLATETSRATEQISGQIGTIQEIATSAGQSISLITEKVKEVGSSTGGITEAVETQRRIAHEITEMAQQSSSRTSSVEELIRDVDDMAKSTDGLSTDLKDKTASVSETVQRLGTRMVEDVREVMQERV